MLLEDIASTPAMIATLTHHQSGTIEQALQLFIQLGLVEELTDGSLFMSNIQAMIGTTSSDAERKRKECSKLNRQKLISSGIKGEGQGLLLWGSVGTGKTFAAACIANTLTEQSVPVLMTNFSKVLNSLLGMFSEDKNKYPASFGEFDLLIIDDLGIERNSEYVQEDSLWVHFILVN